MMTRPIGVRYPKRGESCPFTGMTVHQMREAVSSGDVRIVQSRPKGRVLVILTDLEKWIEENAEKKDA